ncbi:ABC transporter permease [Brevibacillus choshinensis]|uniref:ABC transporter permease n=2 Tax=Brevibacillus choshinensis TaxID=54911 RepID=A0ABX7FYC2_BRECH|nr:ABC transporter permease [Brevibacillus choshinensis]
MTIDVDALFRERLQRHLAELVRYGQYMANGGVLMVAVFLCGLLAYYYPNLVKAIPAWFPVPYALALVLAIFITRSPHRTFLLEADLIFLTPAETKMARYFQKTQVYNFVVQSIGLFLVLLLFLPLYQGTIGASGAQVWLYWGVPFVLKGWNVYISWTVLRLPGKQQGAAFSMGRFGLTYFLLAWMLTEGGFLAYQRVPYGAILWMGLLIWFHIRLLQIPKKHAYQWYQLLEMENGLRLRFYQIANQFRDVPSLQQRVKPRKWLMWIAGLIPYRQENAGRVLFLKTFLRSGDLAGMYIRLLVISSLLIIMLPGPLAQIAVTVLFFFMSASQLKGIGSQARHHSRASLLPINEHQQTSAASWVRRVLLGFQVVVNMVLAFV